MCMQQTLPHQRYPSYWSCSSTTQYENGNGQRTNCTGEASQFLGQAMYAGRQAANDIASIQQNQGTSGRPHQNEDLFYDSASEYVTRMAGSLPSDVVEMLQKELLRGTKIILPHGQKLVTTKTAL